MKEIHSLKIHSLKHEIECVVLDACIQEQNNFSKIQKYLLRTDFGIRNKVVFSALQYLHENSKPIDQISVSKQMLIEIKATKDSEKEKYTIISKYLIDLTLLNSNTSNLEYSALLLAQLSIHNQLLEQLHLLLQNNSLPFDLLVDLNYFRESLLPFDCDPLEILDEAVIFLNLTYPNQSELYQPILKIADELELRCFDIRKDFTLEASDSTNQFLKNFTSDSNKIEHWPDSSNNLNSTEAPF